MLDSLIWACLRILQIKLAEYTLVLFANRIVTINHLFIFCSKLINNMLIIIYQFAQISSVIMLLIGTTLNIYVVITAKK